MKNIFLMNLGKFPMFSLSGKMNIQNSLFSLCCVNPGFRTTLPYDLYQIALLQLHPEGSAPSQRQTIMPFPVDPLVQFCNDKT